MKIRWFDLTGAEYVALKAHLAMLRAGAIGSAAKAVPTVMKAGVEGCKTYDEAASNLLAARRLYRAFPHLVASVSADFDRELAELKE